MYLKIAAILLKE